ncbi:MAG TPA: M48 family metallopeptidase [Blastocatellia bacterium]
MNRFSKLSRDASVLALVAMLVSPIGVLGQTRVVAPKNPYSIDKDLQLGQQAAYEVERKLPILHNSEIQYYVERVGRRLVEGIPSEFQHPQFRYSFKVVDTRDVNAFALPGGFTYVNRGLIEAAHNEGEMAGVIAHELSHVALRHGTAQAAKAQKYAVGQVAGQILGAIIGGGIGGVVAQGSQLGIGAYFLRFSREYERQADILGSHIMANAGYDPHDLANIFRTLERMGSSGGPQWLSDHPNPGNRYDYINREADALHVSNPTRNTDDFTQVQAMLRGMPRARSMQEIGRSGGRYPDQQDPDQRYPDQRYPDEYGRRPTGRVEYPSSSLRTYNGSFFRLAIPDNWRELPTGDNVTFAPEGAYGQTQGQFVFTHGIQVGTARVSGRYLQDATDQLINGLSQGNPNLRRYGGYQRENVGRHDGLSVSLSNVSEMTGRPEIVTVYTTMLRNGDLFYMFAVAPQNEYQNYERAFRSILRTVELND